MAPQEYTFVPTEERHSPGYLSESARQFIKLFFFFIEQIRKILYNWRHMPWLQRRSQQLEAQKHVIWTLNFARKTFYNAAVSEIWLASKLKTDNVFFGQLDLDQWQGKNRRIKYIPRVHHMLSAFGSWRSPVGLLGESMEVEDPTAKQPGKINFRWRFCGIYAYRAWLSGIVFLVKSAHWQLLCSCQEYLKLLLENHEMRRLVTRDYTWSYPHIRHGHVVSERVFAFRWCSLWHKNHP